MNRKQRRARIKEITKILKGQPPDTVHMELLNERTALGRAISKKENEDRKKRSLVFMFGGFLEYAKQKMKKKKSK